MTDPSTPGFAPDTDAHVRAHHGDYADFAEMMVKTHAGRFDDVFWAFLKQYAPDSVQRVVDLGTGPGLLLPELATRFSSAEVVGVEAQPEMLRRAQDVAASNERIRLFNHDLSQPPVVGLENDSVCLAVSSMVLHEMPVPTRCLDDVVRILRPGGVFVVLDWVRQPLSSYSDGVRPDSLDRFTHFSEHCRYTPEDLAWLFENSGLEMVEWMSRRKGRFVLMAARKPEPV